MRFKLLVFDWDGTLMDSEARIVGSMQAALKEAGAEERTREQIRNIIGLGLGEAVRALIPDAGEGLQSRVVERYRYHYLDAEVPGDIGQPAEYYQFLDLRFIAGVFNSAWPHAVSETQGNVVLLGYL